jgi:uncharacterized protein (DUF1501 family)
MFTRRQIMQGLMFAGGVSVLPFGRRGWSLAADNGANRHMVMILMRGAVDGLSVVTPFMEPNYYRVRSNIALPPPGQTDGLINLDGFFGLNPNLQAVYPLWQNRSLAFIQASGSPAETRSHFEAQDIMETALLNSASATQGWMNGLVQILPDNHSSTRALAFGNILPKIFQGRYNVSTIPTGIRSNGRKAIENPQMQAELSQLYGSSSALGNLYKQGTDSRESVMQDLSGPDLQKEMIAASGNAPAADAFVQECSKAAEVIKNDPRTQLVFMDVGGWDTHVGQGNSKGQLANKLKNLGDGLAALATGLGAEYANTVILVMSEFGRTVAQNGNNGTDHGHGNVAWVMGGGVRGGKVYGRWPGLEPNQLFAGRDLAVTTDFRSVIGTVAGTQFGLSQSALGQFIPGYQPDAGLQGLLT